MHTPHDGAIDVNEKVVAEGSAIEMGAVERGDSDRGKIQCLKCLRDVHLALRTCTSAQDRIDTLSN